MKLTEFLTALNDRIAAAKVSGFWTTAQKEQWIYEAIVRVCSFRRWKGLELARSTATKIDQEYYDYPDNLSIDSIYYMEVDGGKYIKKSWSEYQALKANESTDQIFTSHNGFYFINPIPSEAGLTIDIWGIKKPVELVEWKAAADDSILSEKFDQSVIKLALASCLQKTGKYNEASAEIAEVEASRNPMVEGSGGLLAKLADSEEDEEPKGYIGRAISTRFS